MIQEFIKEQAESVVPELQWFTDFTDGEDNTAVVYNERPTDERPTGDLGMFTTMYTIQAETSKRKDIEDWMWKVHDKLDKRFKETIVDGSQTYHLVFMRCLNHPWMIGIQNRKSVYQLRVEVILKRI